MMHRSLEELPLDLVSIADVQAYLQAHDWRQIECSDQQLLVFAGPPNKLGEPMLIALPRSKDLGGAELRLTEALHRLAEIERVPPTTLISRIRAASADAIYLRLLIAPSELPSLETVSSFLSGCRNLVTFSACMELIGQRYFVQPTATARRLSKRFQFGHTYQSSFGFVFQAPVTSEQGQLPFASLEGSPVPLGRRVVERITRGLLMLSTAAQLGDDRLLVERYSEGLNANMCSAVAEMLKVVGDTAVEYSVSWSPLLSAPSDLSRLPPLQLHRSSIPYLEKAAQLLRVGHEGISGEEQTITGVITELHWEDAERGQVRLKSPELGTLHLSLESSQYALACDAHRDRRLVSVTGTLVPTPGKRRKIWNLLYPRDFRILEQLA
ncbi:hypothetical protein [Thermogemmatispora carboxidivorans]|uniref:hypothetical protein n=1 Tax=Thermogemmatispora carboxidivorans TaxID=1382306 RepID=UPI0012DF829B|nr:hypothetical protein [Thermogemmatispora carboxidivorans]